MKIEEALEILNLRLPFTFDELKKAYKIQVSINHPDNFSSSPSEIQNRQNVITQRLNEARKILTNYLNSNVGSMNLSQTKTYYCNLLDSYCIKNNRYRSLKSNSILYTIDFMISDFYMRIKKLDSVLEIQNEFDKFLDELKSIYLRVIVEYKNTHCIYDDFKFEYNFNFNCKPNEFISQLDDYWSKYNEHKENENNRAIDEIVEKAKKKDGYDVLRDKVELLRKKAKARMDSIDFTPSVVLRSLEDDIGKLFNTYFDNIKKYQELTLKYSKLNISDNSIDNKLEKLKNSVLDFNLFSTIYQELLIIINEKVYSNDLNNIYHNVIKKYNDVLLKLKFCDNIEKIEILLNLLTRIVNILSQAFEFKNYDMNFSKLESITFENVDSDIEIIEDYEEQIRKYKLSSENIFRILSSLEKDDYVDSKKGPGVK